MEHFSMICKLTVFCCLLFVAHASAAEKFTPKAPWVTVGTIEGKTYYWDPVNFNSTWIDSLDICHKAGMFMAAIETEKQQTFLTAAGQRLGWNKYLNIAGTDIFDEGNWRWMRSGQLFSYTNWYPGSPYPAPDGLNWNCLGFDTAGWNWVDIWCNTYKVMTLCEYP